MNVPDNFKADYYLNKMPLYMRKAAFAPLFEYGTTFYLELAKMRGGANVKNLLYKKDANLLPSTIIRWDKFQAALFNKFKELEAQGPLSKPLFYYQLFTQILTSAPLSFKNDWRRFLNFFGLRFRIKVRQNLADKNELIIDTDLDPLIKWILKDLVNLNRFDAIKEEKIWDETLADKYRDKLSYYDHATFDFNYFINTNSNDIVLFFDRDGDGNE